MTRQLHSRRQFLEQTTTAIVAAGTCGAFSRIARAARDEPPAAAIPRQAIACTRREAAEAARSVLEEGGNAVDATAAALLVQCVIEPSMVGFGGYGSSFVFFDAKSRRVRSIESTSRAPRDFDLAAFSAETAVHGYRAVGVPGVPAAIDLALREYGTMPFKRLAQPAIELAENGTVPPPAHVASLVNLQKRLDPASRRAQFPQGVPRQGEPWLQADLARLLRQLGDEGLSTFYDGPVAEKIVRQVQEHGGALSTRDLREYEAALLDPLEINYRGVELFTPPLPSGGITTLSILKTLEQFDIPSIEPWSPDYYELLVAAIQLTWRERDQYFGDPDMVSIPVDELLSEKRAIERARQIRAGVPAAPPAPDDKSHTVNIVVVDKNQNVVSWTATHGESYGAQVAIEGLGLMLGHGVSRFDRNSQGPNRPAPRKRPQHNMAPIVMLKDGAPFGVIGMPGGPRIVTVTAQIAVSLLDFKKSPQEAVSAPRLHCESAGPVKVNADVRQPVVSELRKRGHSVELMEPLGGAANAVLIDEHNGHVTAGASGNSSGLLTF